jgi:ABC-2 type transport system ATP-binding protein
MRSPPLVEIRGLGKDYGRRTAVLALDLDVEAGEIVGLLGPNGAGKTTAISMIAGVVAPSRGWARIAGHDVVVAPRDARAAIGIVPQELALYDELTARENLAFFGAVYRLRGALLRERIECALDEVGLSDRGGDAVRGYSGGMKRRLNLAAALLHRPRLLILDEPSVGVDPQSRKRLVDTIGALRTAGTTVLYTSHHLSEVQAICDRVVIMDAGRVIATSGIADLLAGGRDLEAVFLELTGDAPRDERC